jgi:transcription elongation factor Elf1
MKKKSLPLPEFIPCPHCGDVNPHLEQRDQYLFSVVCGACGASSNVSLDRLSRLFTIVAKLHAIGLWNRRAG